MDSSLPSRDRCADSIAAPLAGARVPSPRFGLVDLAFDIAQFVLDVAARVPYALVVDGRPQFADEEVEQLQGAEVADRLVECLREVLLDGAQERRVQLVGQSDAHRGG